MISGLWRLVTLSVLMSVGTMFAAFAPMFFTLSSSRISTISIYGTGLLVGAALTVIIPEGVEQCYSNEEQSSQQHDGQHEHSQLSSWIGGALLLGFITMYLIESFHSHGHSPKPNSRPTPPTARGHERRRSASLYRSTSFASELEPLNGNVSEDDADVHSSYEWDEDANPQASPRIVTRNSTSSSGDTSSHSHDIATVIGLLAHSIADGISLGASSLTPKESTASSNSQSLDLIVFLAIMLHKAPTAFALCSLLLSSNHSHGFVRRALVAFSLAAPLGAMATYFILSLAGVGGSANMAGWTGLVLVFSGGTFLFVSVNAMENTKEEVSHGRNVDGSTLPTSKKRRILLVIAGMITPGLLSRLVGHGH